MTNTDRLARVRRLLPDSWHALGAELGEPDPVKSDADPVDDFKDADLMDGQGPGNRQRRDDGRPSPQADSEPVE